MHIRNAQEQLYRLQCVCLLCLFVSFSGRQNLPITKKSYNRYLTKLLWHLSPHMGYLWRTRQSTPVPLPSIQRGANFLLCWLLVQVLWTFKCLKSVGMNTEISVTSFGHTYFKFWNVLKSKYQEEKPLSHCQGCKFSESQQTILQK